LIVRVFVYPKGRDDRGRMTEDSGEEKRILTPKEKACFGCFS